MSDFRTLHPLTSLPLVLGALRVALGAWVGRRVVDGVLAGLVHRRVGEICGRLERMLVRFASGRAMVRGARVARGSAEASGRVRAVAVRVWPEKFGWGLDAGAHEAAGVGGHLRLVLATPEMVELLRASPSARRLLSPVCRMLGIEAAVLSPLLPGEVRPVRVVVVREKKVRVRGPRRIEQIGNIPWPRGIFAMIRKYKKLGKFDR